MTFDDKLDKILLSHGAEQGELHYSLKQAIKDLVLNDVVGENIDVYARANIYASKPGTEGLEQEWYDKGTNDTKNLQRLIINGKENSNE